MSGWLWLRSNKCCNNGSMMETRYAGWRPDLLKSVTISIYRISASGCGVYKLRNVPSFSAPLRSGRSGCQCVSFGLSFPHCDVTMILVQHIHYRSTHPRLADLPLLNSEHPDTLSKVSSVLGLYPSPIFLFTLMLRIFSAVTMIWLTNLPNYNLTIDFWLFHPWLEFVDPAKFADSMPEPRPFWA